jgi:hypothetical protein
MKLILTTKRISSARRSSLWSQTSNSSIWGRGQAIREPAAAKDLEASQEGRSIRATVKLVKGSLQEVGSRSLVLTLLIIILKAENNQTKDKVNTLLETKEGD